MFITRLRKLVLNRWFGRFLLVLFLGATFFLLSNNPQQFEILFATNLDYLAALLAVNLLSFFITGTISWYLLRALGIGVPWSMNVALTFLANLLNYFGPAQPGLGAKAIYLKAVGNTSFTSFATMTAFNAFMMILVSGVVGLVIVTMKWWADNIQLVELGVLSLMMTVFIGILPLFFKLFPYFKNSRYKWLLILSNTLNGIAQLLAQKKVIIVTIVMISLQYIVAGLAVMLSYGAIGVTIDYSNALLIAAFLSVANIVPITPNNIGISELIIGITGQLSGIDFSTGLIVGGIMRVFHLSICIIMIPYFTWQLRGK